MSWLPARYLEMRVAPVQPPTPDLTPRKEWLCLPLSRYAEAREGVVVGDTFVEQRLMPLFDLIRTIHNDKLAGVIRRAVAWHSSGNYLGSGLNRFVNLWESIELLGQFFYSKCSGTEVRSRIRQAACWRSLSVSRWSSLARSWRVNFHSNGLAAFW